MSGATPCPNYEYWATVCRIIDGDTIVVSWHMGKDLTQDNQKIRLFGIDTPELRKPEQREAALKAKAFLEGLLKPGMRVPMHTIKDKTDSIGSRYLGIFFVEKDGVWLNVNDELVKAGHATVYQGAVR